MSGAAGASGEGTAAAGEGPDVDSYVVLAKPVSSAIKIKGSRFAGEAFPAEDVANAEELLRSVRKKSYDATHHCSAYRIGERGEQWRSSDDGEPSGSAGQPILRQIDAAGITNVLVVVTRYYGGTKLGTGGLARAYGDAARAALEKAETRRCIVTRTVEIAFDYADTSPAMHLIGKYAYRTIDSQYGDRTTIRLAVPRSQVASFQTEYVEALSGRGMFTIVET